ncbi:MAG: hypothetical protein AABM67_16690 [Acidobacteriota bacterium]
MVEAPVLDTKPLARFIDRLRTRKVELDPFPHYYVENVLPDDYYDALLAHLPGRDIYQNLFEVTTLKLDHFRYRDQRDLNDGWVETLPENLKRFWTDFNRWFLGPRLAQAVLESFDNELLERFGEKETWPDVSVEAQLICHRAGYFLGPHSDLHSKIVVFLLYLAPDETSSHLGTSIYRPRQPGFTCDNSVHYPFEDFVKVKTAPYRPNSLLAFVRSGRSFHGVEPLSETDTAQGKRDLIQYVLYDKRVREEQLQARRLAAGQRAYE